MFANLVRDIQTSVRERRSQQCPVMSSSADPIWLRPESAGVGRPAERTRADVAAAAIVVAEADGFKAMTMRRVAAELGTGAASLYRYVRNRGELLELVTDHLYGQLPLRRTGKGPRADTIEVLLEGFRQLREHPWFSNVLIERPFSTGPGSARMLEHYLTVLEANSASGPAKMEAIGVLAGMVMNWSTFVLHQNMPELIANQATYLMHVAQAGSHPHIAAVFATPHVGGAGQEPPEATLERILGQVYDGMLGPTDPTFGP
jgi:AcrR family transcriptional regulator